METRKYINDKGGLFEFFLENPFQYAVIPLNEIAESQLIELVETAPSTKRNYLEIYSSVYDRRAVIPWGRMIFPQSL